MKGKWSITLWFMTILPLLIGVIGLVILPDQIPVHYNEALEITHWGSKYESLIWTGLFFLINLALLLMCKHIVRKEKTPGEKRLALWTSFGGMLVLDVLIAALLCMACAAVA